VRRFKEGTLAHVGGSSDFDKRPERLRFNARSFTSLLLLGRQSWWPSRFISVNLTAF